MLQSSYKEIAKILLEKNSFVLTTHISPDGDGLGCEYALYHLLKSNKKDVRIINVGALPENYFFLNDGSIFEQYKSDVHDDCISNSDVLLVLDMNDPKRLAGMEGVSLKSTSLKIVIDHHLRPKEFADCYLIDSDVCATGEILYNIFVELGAQPFSREVADGLYIAIMTDTGSFRFPRTTSRVHTITAELLQTGIRPEVIHQKIFDEYPIGRTRLLGKILAEIELFCDGKATISHVTQSMFEETHTTEEDVEDIVNFGLTIRGITATALLVELENEVRISFRSRGEIDISDIARQFGGGGHKNAAGARIVETSLQTVEANVKKAMEMLLS